MTHDLLIIGAGKYGREVLRLAKEVIRDGAPWRVKGFLDDRQQALARFGYAEPILASTESYEPLPNDRFLCAMGDHELRRRYAGLIQARGGQFATMIHPTATIGDRAALGAGSIIEPFVYVGADVTIGSLTVVGSHTCVGHDNRIGDYCQISGHTSLGGNVVVEDHVFFGLGVMVVPQVKIGRYAFVGAGSIVLSDVGSGSKVFGNPAAAYGKTTAQYAS